MKNRYVFIASAILISVNSFAQKDQIKAAEKALKNGNSAEAKTILQGAESLLPTANDADKAQYYFVKGNTLSDLATKNVEITKNQTDAAKAFTELLAIEKTSGKDKYSEQARLLIANLKAKLYDAAILAGNKQDFSGSSKLLIAVYDLDKTDQEKLYYAAVYAKNAKENETALKYFQDLKTLNYTGEGTTFFAMNKETKKEEFFESKAQREIYIKAGTHEKPRDEKNPSKRGEILKEISTLLIDNNKIDEAKIALQEAKVANPDDVSLILTEADLYYKLNDLVMYKKLIGEALDKNPNNAGLYFNLGVVSRKANQFVDAEKYFKKAIEIDPNYTDAYLNLAELKMVNDEKYFNEMDKLTSSEKDLKKFKLLKAERDKMFQETLPYLEKAYQLDPKNEAGTATLLSVYKALEMMDKVKELKAKM
jgi:tetratricopeptide (TPR) repeat protein